MNSKMECGDTAAPVPISQEDQLEIQELYRRIQRSKAKLVGPDGKTQNLPESLYKFLVQLIADLYEGKSVSIIQSEAQLTTVEAGRLLGVSRRFLINLLENKEIPHHKVGTHRRIYVRDLFAYKAKRDGNRRKVISDLAKAERADGLYEKEPPHVEPD